MISKDWTLNFEVNGLKVKAHIPPYVWMYRQGAIEEVCVVDERGCELRVNTKLNMNTNDPAELEALVSAHTYPTSVCKTCNSPMLAHSSHYRTPNECETCCKERISAEFNKLNERERFKDKVRDTAHKAQGYKFKAIMNVHPVSGDDFQLVQYSFEKPSHKDIKAVLIDNKSTVFDDYRIDVL
jgi:hypothetical protein